MSSRPILISTLLVCAMTTSVLGSGSDGVHADKVGDAVIRRTDAGNNAPLPVNFEPIDLLQLRVEGWETSTPETNPYTGDSTGGDANLVRIQIKLDGLVTPPGPIGLDASPYDPYMFGGRPLFGYIELDLDGQKNSGGELMPLAQNRYLANVGRFGLNPYGSISDRIVREPGDMDSDYSTAPQFERSGSEFTLALCGCFTPGIVSQDGNMDSVFDEGETWIVSGRFFERFIAFAPESGLFGGSDFGQFDPIVDLQFKHDQASDTTTVTLIFPVTNEGAAALLGEWQQSIDLDVSNQTSIAEALDDLIYGSAYATGDLLQLVEQWENRDLEDYYRPRDWDVTAIIGTAPIVKDPQALFVWTDTGFDEVRGDFDDDEVYSPQDCAQLSSLISSLDGTPDDADGMANGEVQVPDFALGFSLHDLNYDGLLNDEDIADIPAYTVEPIAYFTTTTSVRGASDSGHVVGDQVNLGLIQPFIATAENGLVLLPLPSGYTTGAALDVNNAGVIVGTVSDTNFPFDLGEPAIWTPDGNGGYTVTIPEQFATLPGPLGTMSIDGGMAVAINDNGTIVGWSRFFGFQGGPSTQFFQTGAPIDLNALGFEATVTDLNENDVIVGDGLRFDIQSGVVTNLGVPAPGEDDVAFTFVESYSINDQNQVIAAAHRATAGSDRWLTFIHDDLNGWQRYSLNQLPAPFVGFYDNNNAGDVSATGGALFAPDGVLASGFDELLAAGYTQWDTSLGFIADDRRVFTTAFDTSSGDNAIVALVPEGMVPDCPADMNSDGMLNFFDVSAFLVAYNTTDPLADFNNDGLYNFFDVSAFLSGFNAGCP